MSSHFANILKHAKLTCDPINATTFKTNFTALKQLVDKLQATDLAINPELFSQKHFNRPNKAPCTFVSILECDTCTISVFILAESANIPLHDHPNIHGILKTIAGKICLNSYTATPNNYSNEHKVLNQQQMGISVMQEPTKIITTNCDSAILTPNHRNYHEITAVDGPAAFFDILTPPYNTMRKCSFYAKSRSIQENLHHNNVGPELLDENCLYLKRIPCPEHYYCDNGDDDRDIS